MFSDAFRYNDIADLCKPNNGTHIPYTTVGTIHQISSVLNIHKEQLGNQSGHSAGTLALFLLQLQMRFIVLQVHLTIAVKTNTSIVSLTIYIRSTTCTIHSSSLQVKLRSLSGHSLIEPQYKNPHGSHQLPLVEKSIFRQSSISNTTCACLHRVDTTM